MEKQLASIALYRLYNRIMQRDAEISDLWWGILLLEDSGICCILEDHMDELLLAFLLEAGKVAADSEPDDEGRTLLSREAERGHDTVVKILLATGQFDLDLMDDKGRTPLS
jgi:ankyrin repeat protein